MTTQTYEPHWEMHGRTRKQHLIVREWPSAWHIWTACGRFFTPHDFVTGDYERGVDRCRSCDRSAT